VLHSLVLGTFLTFLTIALQSLGTVWWIGRLRPNKKTQLDRVPNRLHSIKILCLSGCFLLLLHILQVTIWAIIYFFVVGKQEFSSFEECCYFSAVTFTSLGFGDVVISSNWRLLSTVQAMVGLFVFGWSSALIFAIVQRMLAVEFIGSHPKPAYTRSMDT